MDPRVGRGSGAGRRVLLVGAGRADLRGSVPVDPAGRGRASEAGSGGTGSMRVREDLPPIDWHPRLASTQDRLRELAAAGAAFGSAVVAEEQTAGRGRGGKGWVSVGGDGLWMSVLLARAPGGDLAGFPLVVGLRVAVGLEEWSGERIMVKWPNDLFVEVVPRDPSGGTRGPEWRKMGGILCETVRSERGGKTRSAPSVAVGIGLNLTGAPEDAAALMPGGMRTLSVREAASVVLDVLVPVPADTPLRLDERVHEGLARRDLLKGRRVRSEVGVEGVASGMGVDGALVVRDDSGREHRIWSGSVRPTAGSFPSLESDSRGDVE
ncbi:MAG: biotin--[acetyl-CoA-carboxylase] ligase [Gemmatimonadales bacterium]|nr:MAG: biotin--[acetyl-CoA-carboxylase] ligase [Gemmatimonadales bacterium]